MTRAVSGPQLARHVSRLLPHHVLRLPASPQLRRSVRAVPQNPSILSSPVSSHHPPPDSPVTNRPVPTVRAIVRPRSADVFRLPASSQLRRSVQAVPQNPSSARRPSAVSHPSATGRLLRCPTPTRAGRRAPGRSRTPPSSCAGLPPSEPASPAAPPRPRPRRPPPRRSSPPRLPARSASSVARPARALARPPTVRRRRSSAKGRRRRRAAGRRAAWDARRPAAAAAAARGPSGASAACCDLGWSGPVASDSPVRRQSSRLGFLSPLLARQSATDRSLRPPSVDQPINHLLALI